MISTITTLLKLLCGVSLFLYGMGVMGDALKKVAGNKLESLLYKLTNNTFKGLLLGTAVTAVIQSSSATTVMVVGFVNSGMMKVAQAIGIILGANVGTSVTGWILCLSYIDGESGIASILSTATISAIVAIIGIVLMKFTKKDVNHHVGEIMLGFAILMTGMQTMSGAVAPLKENPVFLNMLTSLNNPLLGILAGIVFTAVLQSASASVGILQALSITGAITFASSFPMIMGIGVGAAAPVLLSAIGTNKNGQRTAFVYLLNDTIGMVCWTVIFYALNFIFHFGFMGEVMGPVTIAMLNSVYRTINSVVLSFFTKQIEAMVNFIIKDNNEDMEEQKDFDLLEERFLNYPDLAIAQSHTAMNGMAKKARKNFYRALKLMNQYTEEKYNKVQEKEDLIDKYEDKLGTYLMQLTSREMNGQQTQQTSKFLHTISDFERIGDHASAISKVSKELYDKKITFSEDAREELDILTKATGEIVDITVKAFVDDDLEAARCVEPLRQYITAVCGEMKSRHIYRLQCGKCGMTQGFPFNDMLTNMDRVAAHCSNVAVAMIELEASDFDTHAYVKSIQNMKNDHFVDAFNNYAKKYPLPAFDKQLDKDLNAVEKSVSDKIDSAKAEERKPEVNISEESKSKESKSKEAQTAIPESADSEDDDI